MAHPASPLPNRFPCWCRATYSWGGESKRDLGFVEGDLIECLNAGDGSWWMGRLRRDKRAMGLFPSNFVQVLDETFHPVSRASTSMPIGPVILSAAKASPQKSKPFRKPFQAYSRAGSPNPATTVANLVARSQGPSPISSRQSSSLQQPSASPSRQPSHIETPLSSSMHSTHQRPAPSPTKHSKYVQTLGIQTQKTGLPQDSAVSTRQASYLMDSSSARSPRHGSAHSFRVSSPAPPPFSQPPFDQSGIGDDNLDCSPPPPPPPHRTVYRAPSERNMQMKERNPNLTGAGSVGPPSPIVPGHTPSPLRDAMDDVMSSLQDMAMRRNEQSPPPEPESEELLDPCSPEAFEELKPSAQTRVRQRPRSSLGISSFQRGFEDGENENNEPRPSYGNEAPQLYNYVERMEMRLQNAGPNNFCASDELFLPGDHMGPPPAPPPKNSPYEPRPRSSFGMRGSVTNSITSSKKLRNRKSAYELGRSMLDRTFTTKSSATNSSSGVQSVATNGTTSTTRTSQSIMSGHSAGGFSATSAGSLARRKWGSVSSKDGPMSVIGTGQNVIAGPSGGMSATQSLTASHYSSDQSKPGWNGAIGPSACAAESNTLLGGLVTPKSKKSGFFKKLVESAKTGAASARSTIAAGQAETSRSPIKNLLPNGVTAIAGGSGVRDMGLESSKSDYDWVQVRRDVNRSNSLSRNERMERAERCQMMDYPVIAPVDALSESTEGDEGIEGYHIEQPTDYQTVNLQLVDKSARFVNSLPPMTNATSLAHGYVCRPYKSDVQKLRALFTWVSGKIAWEEDFEGDVDTRRVIQMRRGCSEEIAVLVSEMCSAVGLLAEVVRGYLKSPGDTPEQDLNPRPNHWWNAVVVDGCWRIMDCSLASPTNPKRSLYSSAGSQIAENGFFLARPTEICYTHVPSLVEQQHICPPMAPDILFALPCACPPYFKNQLQLIEYDTSAFRVENLELVHLQFTVPPDVECVAEVEARSFARDADGDVFESGDTTTTRSLCQAEWVGGHKRFTVKAHLPADEGHGTLKVYAGKRGLMHSVKDNAHPLAFSIPIIHTGENPPYEFFLRHPTPHAQRHDLYVAQPQCARLAINNTFVFAVRQHPSSLDCSSPAERSTSPSPFGRPSSAMSMVSSAALNADYFSQTSSNSSNTHNPRVEKPAKLAIQAPSGKILRLTRKSDNCTSSAESADGGVWETIIKIGERGTWRGLVLADRSARWCVFGEWHCV